LILQSLDELDGELSRGEFQPVYLVLGPEQYQCNQAVALLKKKMVSPETMAFDYREFEAGKDPVDEIIGAANTFPMIAKRKVVFVDQVQQFKDSEQDLILEAINGLPRRSTLILATEDLDHRKKFYKKIRDECCVAEFPKLKGVALEKWAEAYVRREGYRISSSAVSKIVDLAGSGLQNLAMELDKLLLYCGSSKTVPDSAVDDLVRESRQQSIFELIGALGRRDRSSALKSLANLLSMGEHPLVVITMMARHCRQVMIAQECLQQGKPAREIGSAAQIPPFMLELFLRQARSADSGSVRQMYVKLAEIDRRLKSSAADGRMLLESLVCALI
jgi:DNA polymerase III subunit delta